jgi:hypothetical protein
VTRTYAGDAVALADLLLSGRLRLDQLAPTVRAEVVALVSHRRVTRTLARIAEDAERAAAHVTPPRDVSAWAHL